MAYELIGLEKFAESCAAQFRRNAEGHAELVVCCATTDASGKRHVFRRVVDLDPLVKHFHKMLVDYHTKLHGGAAVGFSFGSLLDSAKSVASRVAKSSAVKSLYNQVKPFVEENVPGAKAALRLANKAHDVLVKARKGAPGAIAAVRKLQAQAQAGNQVATSALGMMKRMSAKLGPAQPARPAARALPAAPAGTASYEGDAGPGEYEYDDYGGGEDYDYGGDPEVGGWLYNRPYRDAGLSLNLPFTNQTPRVLYLRGLGR